MGEIIVRIMLIACAIISAIGSGIIIVAIIRHAYFY
jgi:hypothetical protein